MTGWHYRCEDGSEHGPLDEVQIKSLAERGGLLLDTPVSHDDATSGEWVPASRIRDLQERIPEDAEYSETDSPFLTLLDRFASMFSTPLGPIVSILTIVMFGLVLFYSGSGMVVGMRDSAVTVAAADAGQTAEQHVDHGDAEAAQGNPSETWARSREILAQFRVEFVEYKYSDTFYRNPTIELHVRNDTPFAVSRAFFRGRVIGKGRTIPYVEETIDYKIAGGLEPGEAAKWTITLNRYSDWAQVPDDESIELVTTVEPCRLDGPEGVTLAHSQP